MNVLRTPGFDRRLPALLLAVFAVAILFRGLYWLEVRSLPLFQEPTGDAATHLAMAHEIAQDGLAAPHGSPYTQAPLYPFFLRGAEALGLGLDGVRAIQFLLGAAGAVLLALLGFRLAGFPGAAVAGLGGALYGPFIFFEGELLSISLAVFLVEAGLVLWGRRRAALLAGLAWGLAALAQPNLLLFAVAVAVVAVAVPRRLRLPRRTAAWLLLLGILAPAALTGIRNLAVSGEPVLISSNGGINYFIGNNPATDGTFHLPADSGLLNRPEGLFTSARETAEHAAGRPLSAAQVDRWWGLRGLDFWIAQPGHALGLFARKVLLALNNFEVPNHYDFGYFRGKAVVLWLLPTLGWLLPLGGVGLVLALRRRQWLLPLGFLVVLVSVAAFFVTARYRLPLAVFLWPAAGLTVERVLAWRRVPRRWGPVAGAAVLYAVLAFVPLVRGGDTRAHMMNLEGAARLEKGDVAGATESFRKAVEADPRNAEALNNFGKMLARQGRTQEAMQYLRRAMAADPTQAETYFNVEEIYRQAGQPRDALHALDALVKARDGRVDDVAGTLAYRRAVNTCALGDTTEALDYLEQAVKRSPEIPGPWLTLSVLDRKVGRIDRAVEAAEHAARLAPDVQEAALVQAAAFMAARRDSEAVVAYRRAAGLGKVDNEFHYRLGMALLGSGRVQEAESEFLAANEHHPHAGALWELGRLYEKAGRMQEARTAYQALVQIHAAQAGRAQAQLKAMGPPKTRGQR
jgi:tetratricopeptide (TPR) repeat protein